jgi:hypothetical protein
MAEAAALRPKIIFLAIQMLHLDNLLVVKALLSKMS